MQTSDTELLGLARIGIRISRDRLLLLFAASNLAFLAVDVAIAHSVNSFVPAYEWIPVFAPWGGVATCLILSLRRSTTLTRNAGLSSEAAAASRSAAAEDSAASTEDASSPILLALHVLMMLANVAVGVLGFAFHLMAVSAPAGGWEWAWVVFGAPVLAPLSFAGVGLVGLVAALQEDPRHPGRLALPGLVRVTAPISKTRHLLWLTGLGFLGAGLTSFLDHGQYGYRWTEWIPVVAGTYAALLTISRALISRNAARARMTRQDDAAYLWTMFGLIVVGLLGLAFHMSKDLADSGGLSLERMRSFAPIFAPLLFADLGALGLLVVLDYRQTE